jgi:DNA-directed RNA polymerase subunit beta
MEKSFTGRKRLRRSYGRIEEVTPLPDLIELQRSSYESFLHYTTHRKEKQEGGLLEVLKSIFPIRDYAGRAQLEFCRYDFDTPKYDEHECRQRGLTYAASLKIILRLVVWDIEEETGSKTIHDIKEQEVYITDIPLMTDRGTFMVNGVERVVVSQMHRSPGVFFDHDKGKVHTSGKILYAGRVVPYRGSWLDMEFDPKDVIYARIDRRRKFPVTTFLMALESSLMDQVREQAAKEGKIIKTRDIIGMSREEILSCFYETITYKKHEKGWTTPYVMEKWQNIKVFADVVHAETDKVLVQSGTKITPRLAKKLSNDGVKDFLQKPEDLIGQYVACDYVNEQTGEIYLEAGTDINQESLDIIEKLGFEEISILLIDHISVGPYLLNTLMADKNHNRIEALLDIYRALRPGEPPSVEGGEAAFRSLFFDPERYDLSAVGRVKLNSRLEVDAADDVRILRKEDITRMLKILLDLKDGRGEIDDIDNLANRRVRSVGELIENQFRVGLVRMERSIHERMGSVDFNSVMPNDLINAKPISAAMREFFGSSQLSQFMDQVNPLSEITHKRRLSALGPGGLSRDRASFEVRDVHPTHYGRICPIETPEGPNIGLINSLSTYAKVNKYGFIESPYRVVKDGKVTDEVVYLNALQEGMHTIAQATIDLDKDNKIIEEFVTCRKGGEFGIFPRSSVDFTDVSPQQLVSVAASLIPFLENDDANRALMGSNMQRQAVPLLRPEAPLIGTGMEHIVARDSGAVIRAKRPGVVDQVDGKRIVVKAIEEKDTSRSVVDIYDLLKFQRSNMSTCINQRPLVKKGDLVRAGDIIADGQATDMGELALGRNVLVAFMSWQGYNFEDSIIISERIVQDDVFTSIHIEEFEMMARDTKLGNEEITRDVPNVNEELIKSLDEAGIVYVGAEVKAGDILVGKVTPKGEAPSSPEEKLLRAIFGEKAADVRDTSLRVPSGVNGTVVEVRVYSRRGVEKDERSLGIERQEIDVYARNRDAEKKILRAAFLERLCSYLDEQCVVSGPKSLKSGQVLNKKTLQHMSFEECRQIIVSDPNVSTDLVEINKQFDRDTKRIDHIFDDKVRKLRQGDELPPGVLKMVKVFVAVKRKLQPGDKMAGRHGNKGVVSRIVPIEDMPYMEDGTPIDVILNPLGVPSRMNVGQILETHLGAAVAEFGKTIEQALRKYKNKELDIKQLKKSMAQFYHGEDDIKDIMKRNEEDTIDLARNLTKGVPIATPVFDGASEEDITTALKMAGRETSGQVVLYDGRSGEPFDRKITVGYIFMLKLNHLVDDKIHARSIGPYSLVTQQPLGGKAQFGGQRFGEMEVWALEAYGASYTLREILTVKSDDVLGRTKVYEAIVRGDNNIECGIPESFNVLTKELKSLGLNIIFENKSSNENIGVN